MKEKGVVKGLKYFLFERVISEKNEIYEYIHNESFGDPTF